VRLRRVLIGAAAAALVLAAAAIVDALTDDEIRDCASALAAAQEANSAHVDTMRAMEQTRRADPRVVERASLLEEKTQHELDAARIEVMLLCHYHQEPTT
jgi:hypothetical protein